MYRNNRIGPWPLVNLEDGPIIIAGTTVEGAVQGLPTVGYVTDANAPNISHAAKTYEIDAGVQISADSGIAIGTKVVGSELAENATNGEYLFALGGAMRFGSADIGMAVEAVVGRVATGGLTQGFLAEYALVPMLQSHVVSANGEAVFGSVNMQMVLGDWSPTGIIGEEELFGGFWITNHGASPANITRIVASVSLHRYEFDLHPFDPNR